MRRASRLHTVAPAQTPPAYGLLKQLRWGGDDADGSVRWHASRDLGFCFIAGERSKLQC